ncbi:serine/threonine protein phosphatase PP2A-associated protein [Hysterangium stoloniferum]|nr:serine/threonine protein phosphatase PP2A-associated protein [Hysterangium stoloniferum]
MSSESNISLRGLFTRALQDASRALKMVTMEDETQDLVHSSLRDLKVLSEGVDVAGIFSPNETLEDLATGHLPYLLVEYVAAEMQGRLKISDQKERMKALKNSQQHLHVFLQRLHQYEIIPEDDQKVYSKRSYDIKDPVKRRELKIKQYKTEKQLRSSIEIIRKRRELPVVGSNDDLDLIASMLPSSDEAQQDDDDEEILRQIYLLIVRLVWVQAHSQLESMDQEMELLRNAPSPEPEPQPQAREDRETMWRLDPSVPRGGPDGKGPLMDSSGRPLRPFTILPGSSASERSRFQAEVFRPDHRLPTMTMDEYLEEEKRRGNIITGGGPQSQNAPTRTEQLTLDAEMDGTAEAERKAEEKRQEEEQWAQYTDLHPKGEGNTMNRG